MTKKERIFPLPEDVDRSSETVLADRPFISDKEPLRGTEAQHQGVRKISEAWPAWKERLTAVLEKLEEDQFLVISAKRGNHYIQFSCQGSFGLRVETTSNEYLAESQKLSASQVQALLSAGWTSPTGDSLSATPALDPDGSPNFFADFDVPVPFDTVADLTVRTLSRILGFAHPGWLQCQAFEMDGSELEFPELGLKRATPPDDDGRPEALREQLLHAIRETTCLPELEYDGDGNIGVGTGSVAVYASWIKGMTMVRFLSPLLKDVEDQPGLLERLNKLNAALPLARLYHSNETIFVVAEVWARPFSKGKISETFRDFSQLANKLHQPLYREFGGLLPRRASSESVVKH